MRKTILFLLSVCAFGQTANPSGVMFTPLGWPLCESPVSSMYPCPAGQYAPLAEPDLLQVKAISASTLAFRYAITGTDVNGAVRHFHGIFSRSDDVNGYSSLVVYAGNLSGVSIKIEELGLSGAQAIRPR